MWVRSLATAVQRSKLDAVAPAGRLDRGPVAWIGVASKTLPLDMRFVPQRLAATWSPQAPQMPADLSSCKVACRRRLLTGARGGGATGKEEAGGRSSLTSRWPERTACAGGEEVAWEANFVGDGVLLFGVDVWERTIFSIEPEGCNSNQHPATATANQRPRTPQANRSRSPSLPRGTATNTTGRQGEPPQLQHPTHST